MRICPARSLPAELPAPLDLTPSHPDEMRNHCGPGAGRGRTEAAPTPILSTVSPAAAIRPIPRLAGALEPVIAHWLEVLHWFRERAHDRLAPDGTYDRTEFVTRFEQFERILTALVQDFFKTTDELDQILEDANA